MIGPVRRVVAGLELIEVAGAEMTLVFTPGLGGRLLSARCAGSEILWHNDRLLDGDLAPRMPMTRWPDGRGAMGSWANPGGSKTWPAPQGWSGQGEWAGPPDEVLDSGAFNWAGSTAPDGAVTVTITSGDNARTRLRVTRSFTVPTTGRSFTQRTSFTNISAAPVRWSIWEVCQVATGPDSGVPVPAVPPGGDPAGITVTLDHDSVHDHDHDPGAAVVALGRWFGSGDVQLSAGRAHLPPGRSVAKWGFPTAAGRVSCRRSDGSGLALDFVPDAGAEYPDGGCRVEVWTQCPTPEPLAALGDLHPDADLVELEILGPWAVLDPGATTEQWIRWTLYPAGGFS